MILEIPDVGLFRVVIDTGAALSTISKAIVSAHKMQIQPPDPSQSPLLQQVKDVIPRIGTVSIPCFRIYLPGGKTAEIKMSGGKTFEVVDCDDDFLIGTDLIPTLFPRGIPLSCIIPSSPDTNTPQSTREAVIRKIAALEAASSSSDYVPISSVNPALTDLIQLQNDQGFGEVSPEDVFKSSPTVSVPDNLVESYRRQRDRLMAILLPDIEANARVSVDRMEFTTIPDSELKLEIDMNFSHRLNVRQYPIPISLMAFARIICYGCYQRGSPVVSM